MVSPSPSRSSFLAPAGLFAGPAAWAAHTQAGYALAGGGCPGSPLVFLALGVVFAALAALAGFASLRHASARAQESDSSAGALRAPRSFIAAVGAMTGFLFAIVIVTQASAALFVDGCAR